MGNKIFLADQATQQDILANTKAILSNVGDEDNPFRVVRYGVKINKNDSNPATRITYLYDAVGKTPAAMNFGTGAFDYGDWASTWFVAGTYPVMLKYDGTEDYKLSPTDYTKKIDGTTASDVANTAYAGNAMSAIPRVWISQYEIGNYEYIILCNIQYDSSYHAYAHTRADLSLMDKIYLPCYKGYSDGTRLRSISGQQPVYNKNASQEIALAQANGSLWGIKSWAHRNLINCLLTVMFRNDNLQGAMGNGNLNYQFSLTPTCGVMQTGSLDDKGLFWGANDNTHQVKVFGMEAWWGDQWDRTAGLMIQGGTIKAKMIPPYNTTASGYHDTGITPSGSNGGYIGKSVMTEYGRIPSVASGSASTYQCDGLWFDNAATTYALVGGCCFVGVLCGLWSVILYDSASSAVWSFGASLSCEQPAA